MARMHENILKWGNKYDGPNNYKNNRRGASEDAFWDEEELVDYRGRGRKKKAVKHRGCPENNGEGHVYVWVQDGPYRSWDGRVIISNYEHKVCCGCLYRPKGRKSSRRRQE